MIRILLAAAFLALSAATLQAGSLDDLKAAKAAAEQGKADDALRLFSQALAAGDLSAADKAAAYAGRASEYTAKSLIADAFERLDQARQARAGAIADFSAALKLKTDDASLYVARAQAYALDGQNDPAIADFTAALKLDNSAVILLQRGSSLLAKGDYDGAIADYNAAIALPAKAAKDSKDAGPEPADLYSERGYGAIHRRALRRGRRRFRQGARARHGHAQRRRAVAALSGGLAACRARPRRTE